MSSLLSWKAGLLWLAVCLMCGRSAAASAGSQQADGETTRIVSLVPNLTELAFAVGAGDQVVGVSDFCRYPEEARKRPSVGGLVNPSLEGVLRLRPGVVLLYRSQTDFAGRLTKLGISVEMFQVDTLADLYQAIERVGIVSGQTHQAEQLEAKIRMGLAEVERQGGGTTSASLTLQDKVRGVVIVSRDPAALRGLFQASSGNFLGEIFTMAGGELAVPGGAATTVEDIIRANPDLIIDMSGAASAAKDEAHGQTDPLRQTGAWSALTTVGAVRTEQVYLWADPHAMLLGPSVVETARKMRVLIDSVGQD